MHFPLFAGFEPAKLHWNNHDILVSTRHTPETDMALNYIRARDQGATGFRDALPERFNAPERIRCAREAVGPEPIIVWDLMHFDHQVNPVGHARHVAHLLGPNDRLITVNEPSMEIMNGRPKHEMLDLSIQMTESILEINPDQKFWTCDPTHQVHEDVFWSHDHLIDRFGDSIEVVGINHHACEAHDDIADIVNSFIHRYSNTKVAITETSWHDGHQQAMQRFNHIGCRRGWWAHLGEVLRSVDGPLEAVCWAPWIDMAFEPGQSWPNGWPGIR